MDKKTIFIFLSSIYISMFNNAVIATTRRIEDSQTTSFYIVRHGETDWNVEKRKQGQKDIPLNSIGRKQAERLSQELKHIAFDVGFSSDLQRAYETACIVSDKQLPVIWQDTRLRERCFGQWEGRLWSEFSNASLEEKSDVESDETIILRVFSFLNETRTKHKGKTILVVTHGDVIRNIVASILPIKGDLSDIQTANTCYLKLSYTHEHWVIEELHEIELPQDQNLKNLNQLVFQKT